MDACAARADRRATPPRPPPSTSRTIQRGKTQITFLLRQPLYYACASTDQEPESVVRHGSAHAAGGARALTLARRRLLAPRRRRRGSTSSTCTSRSCRPCPSSSSRASSATGPTLTSAGCLKVRLSRRLLAAARSPPRSRADDSSLAPQGPTPSSRRCSPASGPTSASSRTRSRRCAWRPRSGAQPAGVWPRAPRTQCARPSPPAVLSPH